MDFVRRLLHKPVKEIEAPRTCDDDPLELLKNARAKSVTRKEVLNYTLAPSAPTRQAAPSGGNGFGDGLGGAGMASPDGDNPTSPSWDLVDSDDESDSFDPVIRRAAERAKREREKEAAAAAVAAQRARGADDRQRRSSVVINAEQAAAFVQAESGSTALPYGMRRGTGEHAAVGAGAGGDMGSRPQGGTLARYGSSNARQEGPDKPSGPAAGRRARRASFVMDAPVPGGDPTSPGQPSSSDAGRRNWDTIGSNNSSGVLSNSGLSMFSPLQQSRFGGPAGSSNDGSYASMPFILDSKDEVKPMGRRAGTSSNLSGHYTAADSNGSLSDSLKSPTSPSQQQPQDRPDSSSQQPLGYSTAALFGSQAAPVTQHVPRGRPRRASLVNYTDGAPNGVSNNGGVGVDDENTARGGAVAYNGIMRRGRRTSIVINS